MKTIKKNVRARFVWKKKKVINHHSCVFVCKCDTCGIPSPKAGIITQTVGNLSNLTGVRGVMVWCVSVSTSPIIWVQIGLMTITKILYLCSGCFDAFSRRLKKSGSYNKRRDRIKDALKKKQKTHEESWRSGWASRKRISASAAAFLWLFEIQMTTPKPTTHGRLTLQLNT